MMTRTSDFWLATVWFVSVGHQNLNHKQSEKE